MLTQEIIRIKRDGGALSSAQIQQFIAGVTDNSVSEGQIAALAMAVFLNGMEREEFIALTKAMAASGNILKWEQLTDKGPVLDKHSTGGVGDNVSLMLAPIVAACGGYVPMISGRGLGHTGGTLDKLDSIPGYVSTPDLQVLRQVINDVGCAIIGQTDDLAPADRRMYATRDITATVESIPLIVASILSKKLSAGLGGLVLDVKTGSGAFAAKMTMAQDLAKNLVSVANACGLPASALITDMNQPLACAAGNALEVRNAVTFLDGSHRDTRLAQVTLALAAEMLVLGGICAEPVQALQKVTAKLEDGSALEVFAKMVAALGGPTDFTSRMEQYLPSANVQQQIKVKTAGTIRSMSTRHIGLAVVELGGGRRMATDILDYSVGLTGLPSLGQAMQMGETLCTVHAASQEAAQRAEYLIREAILFGEPLQMSNPVFERIGTGAI
ncbi:Thymidine phosphorylase [hydrothermal vent metagenome]|uniref:Thymidine phosphorylase n=1 Tax=hydrothermal vent metagenome TaxID=652676 RepID=A0A3B0RVU5_9ZZZZ